MSLVNKQWEFLKNVAKLIQYAERKGYKLTGGELYRSQDQQTIYLKNGQTLKTYSRHQDRLAIDLNLFIGNTYITDTVLYQDLGEYWQSLSPRNRWGGDWNKNGSISDERFLDGNHFEMLA